VRPKPASTVTLSLTIISVARRFVWSAEPVSSRTMISIFLPATVSPFCAIQRGAGLDLTACGCERTRHRQDDADLHDLLGERWRGAQCRERDAGRNGCFPECHAFLPCGPVPDRFGAAGQRSSGIQKARPSKRMQATHWFDRRMRFNTW